MVEDREIDDFVDELDDDNTISADKSDPIIDGTYPTKVNFSRSTPSVFEIFRQYNERKNINLAPSFQREKVWSKKQNSELIESILMGIPLPIMYFFQDEKGNIQVVDGKQRLTALFEFMKENGNGYTLSELTILRDLKGKKFKDLEPYQRANIEDYELVINIIKPPTPDRIKFDIFDRVNRGGTRLNNQEMRNAIYQGSATELLKRLSENEWFQKAIDKAIGSKFMKDRYVILRAITFMMYKNGQFQESYNSDIDDFIGKSMKYINEMSSEEISLIEQSFIKSMINSFEILGENGFRASSYYNSERKRPINMALFEALTYVMSHDIVENDRHKTKKLIEQLFKDDKFTDSIASPVDSSVKVNRRFEYMDKVLEELKK
ncbi:MAG: DUF262 domain-containing protein [Campylobacterales bacterium]|nr:DUF262 domain-containing protein [Campylobacterales bacterium]